MKRFDWNAEKNEKLIEERGISFEEIIAVLAEKGPLNVIKHHNREKYPHQFIYIVDINDYIYFVPFVEDAKKIFLKTIIPNGRATKKYLRGKNEKTNKIE